MNYLTFKAQEYCRKMHRLGLDLSQNPNFDAAVFHNITEEAYDACWWELHDLDTLHLREEDVPTKP
jgi:hypothetical protein